MPGIDRETIDDFLSQKRLALVGVSRNPKDFSRGVFRDLINKGYDVVPVNPNTAEIEGQASFPRLQEVEPAVDGAIIMTPAAAATTVVRDCAEAGIGRVWMQSPGGLGPAQKEAVDFCRDNGIQVVPGACIYMFLPETAFFHKIHALFLKLFGKYPQ
ncbi:CoA-binding protein [candidate division KSB1 bacterium]